MVSGDTEDGLMNPHELNRTLRVVHPVVEPRRRLVCIPYAGGAASLFHAWSPQLPSDVELRAVQLPARQDRRRDPPLTCVADIVHHLTSLMAQLRPLPTVLFGHSFGALIAFELARELHANGMPPVCLVVSACRAPHLPLTHPALHTLPKADFLAGMNRYCGTPWDTLRNAELMDLSLPALRADFQAVETFTYSAPGRLDAPAVVLRGRRDESVSAESARAWDEVIRGELSLYEVDAGHFFMDTHRSWVLERVNDVLRAASPSPHTGTWSRPSISPHAARPARDR
jgi:medium-chain acyl-[acyl-carrier-protein] hydrolase